jgi:hypothetical protein
MRSFRSFPVKHFSRRKGSIAPDDSPGQPDATG